MEYGNVKICGSAVYRIGIDVKNEDEDDDDVKELKVLFKSNTFIQI